MRIKILGTVSDTSPAEDRLEKQSTWGNEQWKPGQTPGWPLRTRIKMNNQRTQGIEKPTPRGKGYDKDWDDE